MDERTNGWVEGWMMAGWMDWWKDGLMGRGMDGWMDGRLDARVDGLMGELDESFDIQIISLSTFIYNILSHVYALVFLGTLSCLLLTFWLLPS